MAVMIERLAPEATGAQIADALTRDGCAVVEGMADSAAMDELMRETEMDFATRKLGIDEFSGYKTKRVSGLMAKSAVARELALLPAILEAADILLLPNCQHYGAGGQLRDQDRVRRSARHRHFFLAVFVRTRPGRGAALAGLSRSPRRPRPLPRSLAGGASGVGGRPGVANSA